MRGERERGKNEEEQAPSACFLPLLSLPHRRRLFPRVLADRASRRCTRECVPEEFDFSGDNGMDAGAEKCRDAAAAAGEAGSDLYAVLGLKKECSDTELKVAYRKLAMVSNWIHLVS